MGDLSPNLVCVAGPLLGRTIRLEAQSLVFGRDLDCRNGTFLDGVPVFEAELKPGDELRIGGSIFVFTQSAEVVEPSSARTVVQSSAMRWLTRSARERQSLLDISTAHQGEPGVEPIARRLLLSLQFALQSHACAVVLFWDGLDAPGRSPSTGTRPFLIPNFSYRSSAPKMPPPGTVSSPLPSSGQGRTSASCGPKAPPSTMPTDAWPPATTWRATTNRCRRSTGSSPASPRFRPPFSSSANAEPAANSSPKLSTGVPLLAVCSVSRSSRQMGCRRPACSATTGPATSANSNSNGGVTLAADRLGLHPDYLHRLMSTMELR